MVTQSKRPNAAFSIAIGSPVKMIQKMLATVLAAEPSSVISFPNGAKVSLANLKHCLPKGIPIIVIHHKSPAKAQLRLLTSPPQMIHKMFPRVFILHLHDYALSDNTRSVVDKLKHRRKDKRHNRHQLN